MDLLPNIYNTLKGLCSRKRSRTPMFSENLINLRRKRKFSSLGNPSLLAPHSNYLNHKNTQIPSCPKDLFNELVRDPTNPTSIKSVVDILADVQKKAESCLDSRLKRKYSIKKNSMVSRFSVKKKTSKLQKFLDDRNIESVHSEKIKEKWAAIQEHADSDFFCKIGEYNLTYKDVKLLIPGHWLNDQIINAYIKLCKFDQRTLIFNSYFFQTLEMMNDSAWDLEKIKRILKNLGIDSFTSVPYMIMPINIDSNHWVVASINNSEKVIEYYDSLNGYSMEKVCEVLEKFMQQLSIEAYDWEMIAVPKLTCSNDCGIFAIKVIQALAQNIGFQFTSEDIKYYRKIMLVELVEKRIIVSY